MSLSFRVISLSELQQANDLIESGYAETVQGPPLNIDWGWYQNLFAAGVIAICGCFDGLKLIGFVVIMKLADLWESRMMANVVALYLLPEYRQGFNGVRLIRTAEKLAKAMDCKKIRFSVSRKSVFKGKPRSKVFIGLGYSLKELVLEKGL